MYKLIDKIPEGIPEEDIETTHGQYIKNIYPFIFERNMTKEDVFNCALRGCKYDIDVNQLKNKIFKEKSLEKFCAHFVSIITIGVSISLFLMINLDGIIFSSYIKDNTIFMYDEKNNKYLKVYLEKLF